MPVSTHLLHIHMVFRYFRLSICLIGYSSIYFAAASTVLPTPAPDTEMCYQTYHRLHTENLYITRNDPERKPIMLQDPNILEHVQTQYIYQKSANSWLDVVDTPLNSGKVLREQRILSKNTQNNVYLTSQNWSSWPNSIPCGDMMQAAGLPQNALWESNPLVLRGIYNVPLIVGNIWSEQYYDPIQALTLQAQYQYLGLENHIHQFSYTIRSVSSPNWPLYLSYNLNLIGIDQKTPLQASGVLGYFEDGRLTWHDQQIETTKVLDDDPNSPTFPVVHSIENTTIYYSSSSPQALAPAPEIL